MLCERAGVYAVKTGYFLILKPLMERAGGEPVARLPGIVLRDNCAAVYAGTFKIFAYIIFYRFRRNTVITQNGICGNENLTFIRRVGKAFGISGHGGVEHHLPGCGSFVAKRFPCETSAVFKHQDGLACLSHRNFMEYWLVQIDFPYHYRRTIDTGHLLYDCKVSHLFSFGQTYARGQQRIFAGLEFNTSSRL